VRRPALAAALLLLALSSCTDSADDATSPRATSTPPASGNASPMTEGLPAAPAGSRWLGVDGTMIAVPASWRVTSRTCVGKGSGAVVIVDPESPVHRCVVPIGTVDLLVLREEGDASDSSSWEPQPAGHGLDVLASALGCRSSLPPICSQRFAVRGSTFTFSVTIRARGATRQIEAMRKSIRTIPAGYSAVPLIHFGWSVEKATQQLHAAGLRAESPSVDWPHYVTETVPEVGTLLKRGAVVELSIGDG